MTRLTHLNDAGEAAMVDVSGKDETSRTATARGVLRMRAETLALVTEGRAPKGDVLAAARMAAKKTAELIPLCHPLMLSKVAVEITPRPDLPALEIAATVRVKGPTGVEMEALTAVSVAALTLYDMLKAVDKGMVIEDIRLVFKEGGRSGTLDLR